MQEFDHNQTALDFDSDLSEVFVCANTARALEIRTEESRTPLSENADGSLRSLASAPGYRFMSFVDPVITDAIRLYTSTPAFVAAKQQRIMAYANNSTELRDDLATSAQTQCAPLVPIAWVMSRKRWRSCV